VLVVGLVALANVASAELLDDPRFGIGHLEITVRCNGNRESYRRSAEVCTCTAVSFVAPYKNSLQYIDSKQQTANSKQQTAEWVASV
jgi:hypothetical protein